MSAIISIALPVFAVIAAGLFAGRLKLAGAEDAAALNRFVFRFAMPAALFGLTSGAKQLSHEDGLIALAYGIPALAVMAGAYFIGRRMFSLSRPDAGAHAFASTVGNAVFLGLPIALSIEGWARPFVVLMLVEGILVIGAGAALMAAGEGEAKGGALSSLATFFLRPLRNPLVVAALAGLIFASLGLALPHPARAFFDLIGRAAGPTALFSLGLFLATHPLPSVKSEAAKIAAIPLLKMAALPLAAQILVRIFGVTDHSYLAAIALFTATPTAVGAYVMATHYGHYVKETVAAIAVSTALAVLTISAVLVLYN
ncbi:MAG TPA: AEC family transporter [Parvularculaceae bacterium]|nr:AEC family transporter [Parvularculaceae bacterium]